jgi:cytochrome c553
MFGRKQSRRSRIFVSVIAAAICGLAASDLRAADPLQDKLQLCSTCHGEKGISKMEKTPSLAGQPELFLTNQLILIRDKLRQSEIMAPFVKGMKDDEIIALSAHFSKFAPQPTDEPVDQALVARGTELAQKMFCGQCHLPDFAGREQMPRLTGQRLDYLIISLTAYRDGSRSGIDTSMNGVMVGMSDQDVRALAHYMASIR